MKSNCLSIILICALSSSALRVPFQQSKPPTLRSRSFGKSQTNSVVNTASGDEGDALLSTPNDLIYMANVNVGGAEYIVQLDTGSSDFWVKGDSFPLSNVSSTTTTFNLTYGIGWAYGNISTAEVDFAGITIPKQAFLDVSSATNPALSYGAKGVLGLGFTSLSNIDHAVNESGGSWGRSVLYNAFLDNPNEKNYITFALQRSTEQNDDVEGAFTIGEINETYSDINNANALSTWPVTSPSRWNVLLDAFMVGTDTFSVSTNVSDVPSNKAVVLLDSGTSYSYVSTDVAQSIFGKVEGATYDSEQGLWTVPCSAEVDMALQFGGDIFPLHPLDVVSSDSSTTDSSCIGTFIPQSVSVGAGEFDWILGDNFLRAVYTMYDFGDFDSSGNMGNPYVKLLSLVDPNEASAEFVAARGGTARTNITYNAADGSSSGTSNVSVSGSVADKLSKLVDYIPAVLAIMALNALALLIVGVVGIAYMCRRRKRKNSKKEQRALLALDHRVPTPYPSGSFANGGGEHEYEPVSTYVPAGERGPEDTSFTPPAPAFHSYEGDTLRPLPPGARPLSTATGMGLPRDYRVSAAGSDMTAVMPPSPGFKSIDRPKSVA